MSRANGPPFRQFFHRINPDLSMDSICGFCLLTAATAPNETALRTIESSHQCTPKSGNRTKADQRARK